MPAKSGSAQAHPLRPTCNIIEDSELTQNMDLASELQPYEQQFGFNRRVNMHRFSSIVLVLLMVTTYAAAQTTESAGHGYAFAAPGAIAGHGGGTAAMHYGGGGEGFITKGFGLGGEVGYFTPARAHSQGFGIASANGVYRFKGAGKDGRVVPFVTGGYSLFFRGGPDNAANFGGGVNYWFKEKLGLRVEFRDHFFVVDPGTHFLGVRIGITFR